MLTGPGVLVVLVELVLVLVVELVEVVDVLVLVVLLVVETPAQAPATHASSIVNRLPSSQVTPSAASWAMHAPATHVLWT